MPIAHRDFIPEMLDAGGLFRAPDFEPFERTLRRANEWIDNNHIALVNVETVVLPNVFSPGEEGTKDPALHTSGEMASRWHQFIRIWYRNAQ